MKIYYAHSRMKYNTMIEQYELALIRREFPDAEIINPNGMVDQNQSEEAAMKECLKLIYECDVLVFSSVNGVVGKGVFGEIVSAYAATPEVYYLDKNTLDPRRRVNFKEIRNNNFPNTGITPDMIYAIVV